MAKLRATIVAEWEVPDDHLGDYNATTIQEAAEQQQRWCDPEGEEYMSSPEDILSWAEAATITIEPVIEPVEDSRMALRVKLASLPMLPEYKVGRKGICTAKPGVEGTILCILSPLVLLQYDDGSFLTTPWWEIWVKGQPEPVLELLVRQAEELQNQRGIFATEMARHLGK